MSITRSINEFYNLLTKGGPTTTSNVSIGRSTNEFYNLPTTGGPTTTSQPSNSGSGWFAENGLELFKTLGETASSIWGKGGQGIKYNTTADTSNVNWTGILLGVAVIGGILFIAYKAFKR